MAYILDVLVGFQNFVTQFLDEVLFQDVVHINDFPFLKDAWVALDILSSYVAHWLYYFIQTILPFPFLFLLASFDKKVMQVCGDIMGPGS